MNTVIVDYDLGNFGSVKNRLSHLAHELIVSSDIDDILKSDTWIITGDYSLFNKCRLLLNKRNKMKIVIEDLAQEFILKSEISWA